MGGPRTSPASLDVLTGRSHKQGGSRVRFDEVHKWGGFNPNFAGFLAAQDDAHMLELESKLQATARSNARCCTDFARGVLQ